MVESGIFLIITLPEVCNTLKVIGIDKGGTFVPKQTPDGVSVLDGPVRCFLGCNINTCRHTETSVQKLTQYLVPIPLALAEEI